MVIELFSSKPVLIGAHLGAAIVGIDAFLWLLGEVRARVGSVRKRVSVAILGLLGYVGSWIIGGYYYVNYYGPLVKPVIKAGAAPWAHAIVMEAKEHIFLFAVPLAITILMLARIPKGDLEKFGLRAPASALLGITAGLGLLIGLMGFIISAAARWGVLS